MAEYSVAELAKMTGRSRVTIYKLCKRLKRKPTVEEILNRKNGRPPKDWSKE